MMVAPTGGLPTGGWHISHGDSGTTAPRHCVMQGQQGPLSEAAIDAAIRRHLREVAEEQELERMFARQGVRVVAQPPPHPLVG